jgi:hypothetical protein
VGPYLTLSQKDQPQQCDMTTVGSPYGTAPAQPQNFTRTRYRRIERITNFGRIDPVLHRPHPQKGRALLFRSPVARSVSPRIGCDRCGAPLRDALENDFPRLGPAFRSNAEPETRPRRTR